ncbi:hypothetical protein CDAR_15781 [Caerostris darwini]|uniref:Uncharacterized protein n=1 Tax=Caerostris darwini TaxID=1538125 RepID=A0AAV4NA53_9ARAC|nr:hypothetical protein CDAR_15781 [Caerostris darwini]
MYFCSIFLPTWTRKKVIGPEKSPGSVPPLRLFVEYFYTPWVSPLFQSLLIKDGGSGKRCEFLTRGLGNGRGWTKTSEKWELGEFNIHLFQTWLCLMATGVAD